MLRAAFDTGATEASRLYGVKIALSFSDIGDGLSEQWKAVKQDLGFGEPEPPSLLRRALPWATALGAGAGAYALMRRPTFSKVPGLRAIQEAGQKGFHRVVPVALQEGQKDLRFLDKLKMFLREGEGAIPVDVATGKAVGTASGVKDIEGVMFGRNVNSLRPGLGPQKAVRGGIDIEGPLETQQKLTDFGAKGKGEEAKLFQRYAPGSMPATQTELLPYIQEARDAHRQALRGKRISGLDSAVSGFDLSGKNPAEIGAKRRAAAPAILEKIKGMVPYENFHISPEMAMDPAHLPTSADNWVEHLQAYHDHILDPANATALQALKTPQDQLAYAQQKGITKGWVLNSLLKNPDQFHAMEVAQAVHPQAAEARAIQAKLKEQLGFGDNFFLKPVQGMRSDGHFPRGSDDWGAHIQRFHDYIADPQRLQELRQLRDSGNANAYADHLRNHGLLEGKTLLDLLKNPESAMAQEIIQNPMAEWRVHSMGGAAPRALILPRREFKSFGDFAEAAKGHLGIGDGPRTKDIQAFVEDALSKLPEEYRGGNFNFDIMPHRAPDGSIQYKIIEANPSRMVRPDLGNDAHSGGGASGLLSPRTGIPGVGHLHHLAATGRHTIPMAAGGGLLAGLGGLGAGAALNAATSDEES